MLLWLVTEDALPHLPGKKKNQEFIPISWKMHPDPARGGLVGIQGHQDPHSLWHDARKQIKAKPK